MILCEKNCNLLIFNHYTIFLILLILEKNLNCPNKYISSLSFFVHLSNIENIKLMEIKNRLKQLRVSMLQKDIDAYIIPGTDPHASEYFADYWKERDWISGFDGSAGTAVITAKKAGMWVDSRYFLQADMQLKNTGFDTMKMGFPETLDIVPWLISELKSGDKVGVNPLLFSVHAFEDIKTKLEMHGIELISIDLINEIWADRPAMPKDPLFLFDVALAGLESREKIKIVREKMNKCLANVFIVSSLDEIAWLYNIRGSDVDFNPVVTAYALIDEKDAVLYIASEKLDDESIQYFDSQGITVKDYDGLIDDLKLLSEDMNVMIDPNKLNQAVYESIPKVKSIIKQNSPISLMKSIKNESELKGIRNALLKDGVALTRFFMWLEQNLSSGELTEMSIANKLYDFRAEQALFFGESFSTIAGYESHGAIVHYRADEKSNSTILPKGILLLDSGAQYKDGTTDITRTISLGNPTPQQKKDFTLVLKGHIALATAKFPSGTRGSQIDILARKAMWDKGINYGHGTGHGVGHFLNVHEGPQNIRMDENSTVLQPGMFTSNEPGLYRTDEYGIRTENLILVVEAEKTEFGQFYKFETLTLFPIDTTLIEKSVMSTDEINWLNTYHQQVYDTLSPLLSEDEKQWMKKKTQLI